MVLENSIHDNITFNNSTDSADDSDSDSDTEIDSDEDLQAGEKWFVYEN